MVTAPVRPLTELTQSSSTFRKLISNPIESLEPGFSELPATRVPYEMTLPRPLVTITSSRPFFMFTDIGNPENAFTCRASLGPRRNCTGDPMTLPAPSLTVATTVADCPDVSTRPKL